ncbi:MAG: hypothetical protein ACHP9V_04805 [Terriglobales bacterium]
MIRGREAPKGQSAAALRLRAHRQKMAMRAAREAAAAKTGRSTTAPQAAAGWVALGPAPLVSDQNFYGMVSGRSTAIAVDPSDATGNTVYAAAASGGVWKSTNAANSNAANVTWTAVTDQQASLTNGAVSVKPDGTVVLVGTGEPDNAIDSYFGVGILRSADKGATWALIQSSDSGAHSFAGMGFSKFAWSTASPNTVVAATADAFIGDKTALLNINTAWGLYRSTDAGQTWSYQAPTDGSLPVVSATDVTYNATAGKFFASIQYHGVYSSTDGTSWTRIANQPDPTNLTLTNCPTAASSSCPLFRGQLTTVPGRNEMYFWYVDGNDNDFGIWQSTDGGTSWKNIDETGIASCGDNDGCGTQQAFYNLEISAVADSDGTSTDIYAGAVNLFRCKLAKGATTCSTVDANLPNAWLNLTHVYGTCSNKANVHPDEHGLDFLVVGGKDIMYFGNDGGVYRALDGFTGLKVGACATAGTNQFDNLNATIGSMTQFVSFSVHPTDQNTVIGGTQDNGSPATTSATTSSQFFTALGGDGGYNAIDPTTPTTWYNAFTDVQIFRCTTAPSCNDADYSEVVSNATVGGDFGAFYTTYILDPQDASEMLVGTCKVWRGTASGASFSILSNDFDDGLNDQCQGQNINVNLVRGLAAGGPKDGKGFSNVVYATTEGLGPLFAQGTGGEVWVTTNAATTLMSNVTQTINPSNFAMSSVEIDNSDATGQTAYVGIMGFTTSHVFKTTTAGSGAWSDWTGSGATALPDSPVNALLVDSQAGLIYAGTDVGIFVSSTSSASWTEVGPAPGTGSGYLPNVPVSAIRLFNSGGVKKLRTSTYGRGIWEYNLAATPDFTLSASPTSVTITPGGAAGTSTITVTDVNGFAGSVSLVASGLPSGVTAAFNPNPTTSTSTLTLTASGSATVGTATVTITGTSGSLTHTTTVTLTVTSAPDFTLSANPTALSLAQGTKGTSTITVSPTNGFTGTVNLAASGLPSGVTASFNPISTTTTSTLTLTASNSAAVGTATVTITGTSGSLSHTTTVALTVNQNFALNTPTTPAPSPVAAGLPATSTFQVTSTDGKTFASAMTFVCNGLPDATVSCAFSSVAQGATSPQTVTITLQTSGPNKAGAAHRQRADNRSPWLPLALPLAGIVMVGLAGRKMSRGSAIAGLSVSLVLIGLLLACGSSSHPAVIVSVSPAGATVFASGPAGGTWPPQTATFTATVTNNTNTAVNWSVSPATNGGSITSAGVYTAPTIVAGLPGSATVTATSQADTTKFGTATVTITPTTVPGSYPLTVTATEGTVSSPPTSPFALTTD